MYGTLNRNISERSLTTRCQKFYFHKIQVVNFTLDITTGVTHCKIIQLIPIGSYREFSTCWVFSFIFSITDHLSSSFVVRSICASRLLLTLHFLTKKSERDFSYMGCFRLVYTHLTSTHSS